ncbi:MAG: sigma-54-dependent Fis family transcriptional regulator, partial [Acidobacteria bacterium]|nr:sigma-54-dependent Fis family transcriptional regulator [Acidobacteriota bacterium]
MAMTGHILVIDDDEAILQSCRTILEDQGHQVEAGSGGEAGLALLRQCSFDLALIDLKMPGMNGLEVLSKAAALDPDLVLIIFTAYGTIESAVEAVKNGAFNYLTKPFTASQLSAAVVKGLEHGRLLRENVLLRRELKQCCPMHQIVGRSPGLEMMLATIAKVAPSEANVLVTGESGTGKELVARALHANSHRCQGPFIAVDCAALPSHLLESELFGHEKGAYTGANQTKRGLLELAHGGTVFLDEIGELSSELQAKLLRALQERAFRRLGGERLISVDIRVISSTNRDLNTEIQQGRFRQDLLYRLNVVSLALPPLRDRPGDLVLLGHHFLQEFSRAANKPSLRISREVLRLLEQHQWPGNVRELRNVIERAVVLCDTDTVRVRDLPDYVRDQARLGKQIQAARGYKA